MVHNQLYFFMAFHLPDDGFLLNSKHEASKNLIYIYLCFEGLYFFPSFVFYVYTKGEEVKEDKCGRLQIIIIILIFMDPCIVV
jgi:hypothetical protein